MTGAGKGEKCRRVLRSPTLIVTFHPSIPDTFPAPQSSESTNGTAGETIAGVARHTSNGALRVYIHTYIYLASYLSIYTRYIYVYIYILYHRYIEIYVHVNMRSPDKS